MLRAKTKDLRRTMSRRGLLLAGGSALLTSFLGARLFQLLLFSGVSFAIPSLSPILFQIGATLILFPIGYVLIFAVHTVLQKVKMV